MLRHADPILPILVLYNCNLAGSSTYNSFVASAHDGSLDPDAIAIYDNSRHSQLGAQATDRLLAYKHDPGNGGIAAAYNWVLDLAGSYGSRWLLLLDQDSVLPPTFLQSTLSQVEKYEGSPEVVAIVPVVRSGGRAVSPKRVGFCGLRPLPASAAGKQDAEIMAINSGAVIRCDFLRGIGGFNPAYWLDYLDHWLFRQVYATGNTVAVSECILEHQLSVQHHGSSITAMRYENILAAEAAFLTTYKPKLELPCYLLRLLYRSLKMTIHRRPDIALLTAAKMLQITTHPLRSLERRAKRPGHEA
jgi:GT2 family glycosyltransferase